MNYPPIIVLMTSLLFFGRAQLRDIVTEKEAMLALELLEKLKNLQQEDAEITILAQHANKKSLLETQDMIRVAKELRCMDTHHQDGVMEKMDASSSAINQELTKIQQEERPQEMLADVHQLQMAKNAIQTSTPHLKEHVKTWCANENKKAYIL